MKQLPIEYEKRMRSLLGDELDDYIQELKNPPVKAFRVNTDKITVEAFDKINVFSKNRIPYVENGYYLDYDKIGNHPYHHAGLVYVQEPAAMAPVECIDIDPEWVVLDMCAAPGGKSTQIKNKLGENGVLVSNEIIASRCKILTGNVERLGLCNTVTTCMDMSRLADTFPQCFDLVVVDAPCSGEGMFRKEESAIEEWSEGNVVMCARRQGDILDNAVKCLKKGGYIIYSTCTFSLDENEMVVDSFLEKYPEFELIPVKESVKSITRDGIFFDGCKCESISLTRRFYPHVARGEGQFMAVLHHTGEEDSVINCRKPVRQKVEKIVFDFLNDTLTEYNPEYVCMYNKNPVYYNGKLPVKDGRAFSCGVTIGEIKKDRIMPHHQLFMALGVLFKRKIELSLDSPELVKYMRGEEISAQCSNGWAVVTVDGVALGGAKVVNGVAKNHYPKGLRK
ncbi:MAG: NOL1/NOP2/sun family putative RNA methylase [Clostridiales bacterium]|nr:NOL1/NOP2/sun family putative RNA methylase [Clostridiales bacterium]